MKESKWRCAEEAVILMRRRSDKKLGNPSNIQHYVVKSLRLSHRRSRTTGPISNDPSARDESNQFQIDVTVPSLAALCRWRHKYLGYPSALQISAPGFAQLSNSQTRRMRLNVDPQRRHNGIGIHHVLFNQPTQSSEHDSPNPSISVQFLVSCIDPRWSITGFHSAKPCQSNHVAKEKIICRISRLPRRPAHHQSSLSIVRMTMPVNPRAAHNRPAPEISNNSVQKTKPNANVP